MNGMLWNSGVGRRRFALVNMLLGYINVGFGITMGLLLVPMYLKNIGAEMYGRWLATGGVIYWLAMLDLGIGAFVGQRVGAAYGGKDGRGLGAHYTAAWIVQIALLFLVALASGIVAIFVPSIVGSSNGDSIILQRATVLAGLCLGVQFIVNAQSNTLNGLQRPYVKFAGQVVEIAVTIGVTYILLIRGAGLYSIPVGMLSGACANLVIIGPYILILFGRAQIPLLIDGKVLREMVRLARSAFTASTASSLVSRLEPTLITVALGPTMAVVYSITKRAADLSATFVAQLVGSSASGITNLHSGGNESRARKVITQLFVMCLCTELIIGLSYVALNRSFVRLWVGSRFFGGQTMTSLLAVSTVIRAVSSMFGSVLVALGDFRVSYRISTLEGLLRLILVAVSATLIRNAQAVAAAAAIAGVVASAIAAQRLKRQWNIGDDWIRGARELFLIVVALCAVSEVVSRLATPSDWKEFAIIAVAVGGSFAIATWTTNRSWRDVVVEYLPVALKRYRE